tara:strand:+ start:1138 stop:2019 length:882 start_codon:yes stop_codon:yes gene_type:complete
MNSTSTVVVTRRSKSLADRGRELLGRFGVHLFLAGFGIIFALPLYWLFMSSLKEQSEIFKVPPDLWPVNPRWMNFPDVLEVIPFWTYLGNSFALVVWSTIGALISNTFIAYGFARLNWPYRDQVFILVLATMMLPFQVRMIPMYIAFHQIGWLNTLLPLIVPSFFGNAFYIFLLRQFYRTIPMDLSDAARVDGANELQIFWSVVLPLMKPAITTLVLFEVIFTWNDFIGPLIYLRDNDRYTLSIGLRTFFTLYGARWDLLMACSTMFTLPMVIMFFFGQRRFIEGITLTGIKG